LLVLIPVTLWSLNFTVAKYALTHGFSPLAYTAPRFIFIAAAFAMLTLIRERTLRVGRRDLAVLVGAGIVGIFLNQLAFVYALRHSSAATVALLFGVVPIFVGLMSHLSKHEILSGRQWVAAGVSFAGVALVVLGASNSVSADGFGIAMALLAPLTWAAYSVGLAPLLKRHSPLRINAIACLVGVVPLTLVSLRDMRVENWGALSPLAWGALIYGAVVAYVLATIIWLLAIKHMGAPRASLHQNLQPFLGALFALLLLSERLTLLEVVGGAVIGSGIFIAWRVRRPETALADGEPTF
jgi:drug/metabolite transporter (DMT)-like permease